MEIIEQIKEAVIDGDQDGVVDGINVALSQQIEAQVILSNGLIGAMAEVGNLFEEGELFVPEMLVAARAMQSGLGVLKPLLVDSDIKPLGKVVAGTVKGDLHDIGKNLVCMMLEGAGFAINDLGTDVEPEKFVDAVRNGDVDILAMSALLTTTMPNMQATMDALVNAGLRDSVKVMIGGAPVTESYMQKIGADGFAQDASKAVAVAKSLVV